MVMKAGQLCKKARGHNGRHDKINDKDISPNMNTVNIYF